MDEIKSLFALFSLFFALLVVGLSGCLTSSQPGMQASTAKLQETLGKEIVERMASSTRGFCIAINAENEKRGGARIALSHSELEQLKALLLSDDSFLFDYHKRCPFIPEYGFLLEGRGQTLLMVSPSGNQIKVVGVKGGGILEADPIVDKIKKGICKIEKMGRDKS